MGRLVDQQFVTADGFAANADNEFTAYELLDGGTDEFDRSQVEWLDSVEAMVLGANTYRMFAGYWPTEEAAAEIIAAPLNALRRHVFSRTLRHAPWGDLPEATLETGDAGTAIRRIKEETAGDIVLWGSLTLSRAFFAANEVDEVRLVVMPVVIGAGRGAFPPDTDPAVLDLRGAERFDGGLVELRYALRPRPEW
jgi:dihydrofolate reductase